MFFLVVQVGIDPTSSAYEAGTHPSTSLNQMDAGRGIEPRSAELMRLAGSPDLPAQLIFYVMFQVLYSIFPS